MVEILRELQQRLRDFEKSLQKLKSKQVYQLAIQNSAKAIVDLYFRNTREILLKSRAPSEEVSTCDVKMHALLESTHKRSAVSSYMKHMRELMDSLLSFEKILLLHVASATNHSVHEVIDQKIVTTLKQLVPSAALSYEQATFDLQTSQRLSWRGPATDLREALRETLDYLAPDGEVTAQQGFRLEPSTTGPTMKQKVRYVLKRRGISKSAMQTSEDAAEAIDAAIGTVVRSVYTRSNLSTHTPTDKDEVLRVRDWVRVVMCELLEIRQ
jgi:hypothetical protein